jgi:hypothetical protein
MALLPSERVKKILVRGRDSAVEWQDYRDRPTGSGAWVLLFDWDVAPDSNVAAGALDVAA